MKIVQIYFDAHERDKLDKFWDAAFIGKSVDDRGDFSHKFLTDRSQKIVKIDYDAEKFEIEIDGKISLFELQDYSLADLGECLVIDMTTVGFIEMLYLLKIGQKENVNLDAVYYEPISYKKFSSEIPIVQKQYDLSTIVNDFSSLPGYTVVDDLFENKEYLFLTGYEGNRMEAAFEYKETIDGPNSHVIFGVPAYNPGWETNALFNNIEIIDSERISGSVNYSCATDVQHTYNQIKKIIEAMPDIGSNLCILPLSNKPMSLSAALILLIYNEFTNLLYDHPMNLTSRTEEVGRCHLYQIIWNE